MKPTRPRLKKDADRVVQRFTSSISFDRRLYRHDIAGSIAHARMLARGGIISDKDAELIGTGLVSIREEIEKGDFEFKVELEDIHMNIEARLHEKIGGVAGKLHTARSRNDQIALDMRLFVKESVLEAQKGVRGLQRALLHLAGAHRDVILPGYTHLQRAQPVLLAHHLLAYFEMLERDRDRLGHCFDHADVMPLGSGALAGVPYPVDRAFLAGELGFGSISHNSLDAVSDRDFVLEFQAASAMAMMHLSRLAEEIALWSSTEFGFIELDDAFATGSSIMPQKKNPDVAELVRGKTGRVYGHLLAMLTTMKALPLAYNRDLQEDKEGLFDSVDTLLSSLEAMAGMVATVRVQEERCRRAAEEGYMLATDLADYLVRKGTPFREAHAQVGRLVSYALEKGKTLPDLGLEEYRGFSPLFEQDVYNITLESSLGARNSIGGTAPEQVARALERAGKVVEDDAR
ncbi:MAG: argininosuccinate lyase [Dehalococcoidia bacterium]